MKTITIRNIPDDLYKIITNVAKKNNRSIQQQVMNILEKARIFDNDSPLEKAFAIREKLKGRKLGNTVKEIQKERNR